jgi:hypothetical protein
VSSADFLAPHPSFSFPGFSNLPDNENETIPAKQFATPHGRSRAPAAFELQKGYLRLPSAASAGYAAVPGAR